MEGARCFFCLTSEPSDFKRFEEGGFTAGPGNRGPGGGGVTGESINILLKYLIDAKGKKNEKLLKDINDMVRVTRRRRRRGTKEEESVPRMLECDRCAQEVEQIADLHEELEKVQMRMVEGLKVLKGKILRHFVEGSKGEGLCELLKGLVTTGGGMGGGGREERGQRRVLELIADFQMAVYDKGKGAVDVPCLILNKYVFPHQNKSASNGDVAAAAEDLHDNIKTELPEEEEGDNDDDDNHSVCFDEAISQLEYDVSTSIPTSSSVPTIPKLKLRRRTSPPTETPDDRLHSPLFESLENISSSQESPRKKRKCRAASESKATTQRTLSTEEDEDVPVRRRSNRPKKYKKRLKESPGKRVKVKPKSKKRIRPILTCDQCSYSTNNPYKFEQHLRSHEAVLSGGGDTTPQYKCDACSKSFFCEQYFSFHVAGHRGKNAITCDSCNERVPYPEIEAHVKTHAEKIFSCANCSFCSTTRERYLDHLRIHGKGRLECDLCSKPYHTKGKLLEHLYLEHHVVNKYICEVEDCRKEFFDVAHLKVHKYVHTNPHECSQCGKIFGDSTRLRVHQLSHTGEKPFLCSDCPDSFRSASNLRRHRILSHGAQKFKCEYCSNEYMDSSMLRVHLTTHEGTGIPCGICDKVLGSKSLWRRHRIVHTTELTHICEECGKGFTSQQGLKKHSAIHGGEKKYKCQFCEKAFLFPKYLADHERTHTGERPFVCNLCDRGFTQLASLYMHKKSTHRDHVKDSEDSSTNPVSGETASGVPPAEDSSMKHLV